MKRKLALCIMLLTLIVLVTTVFVGCDDKDSDKPSPIQLNENMTSEEIIDLLPSVKNLTYEFLGGKNTGILYTYRMKITNEGYELNYIYDDYTNTYVQYIDGTFIYLSSNSEENGKYNADLTEENLTYYKTFVNRTCNDIKTYFEDGTNWRIENGCLVFFIEPTTGSELYDNKIIYKDFNNSEVDFNYYLSLDIPTLEDDEE